ncbi:IS30 family transposase, partial [Lactobacillus delbrueckii subsp. bulgaricus]|uniref:IS30 family transposase n=1 Tax=Lactobacillus delbrueckii TaxID=1584 RepID=UPI001E54FF52
MIKIEDKTSASVMKAFDKLREYYGSKWNQIFKSITTDNGSEFGDLSDLEQVSKTFVYYAHPYTSCDKGSVERHNGLIRRYIPKGDRMDKYSVEDIA